MSQYMIEEAVMRRQAQQKIQWDNYLTWKQRPEVTRQLRQFKYRQNLIPSSVQSSWDVYFSFTSSHLQANLIGVTAASTPDLSPPTTPICIPYEGELLPEELFEKFASEFHCPTAVQAAHLDYTDEQGKRVKVILLGNPTRLGPNVNSSDLATAALLLSKKYVNVQFQGTILKDAVHSTVGKQLQVKDNCMYISISPEMFVQMKQHKAEIVTIYENEGDRNKFFIAHSDEKTFCDVCFSLKQTNTNPIVCCDVHSCMAGRHLECFKENEAPTKKTLNSHKHNCHEHHHSRQLRTRSVRVERTHKPNSNQPPAFSSAIIAKQYDQVVHERDAVGLQFNCRALGVDVRPSTHKNAGMGLFAQKQFHAGDVIGYFFGQIISEHDYAEKFCEKSKPLSDKFEESFMQEATRGVVRCLDINQSVQDEFDEYRLLVSKQCPVGYINDPLPRKKNGEPMKKAKTKVNCMVQFPRTVTTEEDGKVSWKEFPIVATSTIVTNQEFFFHYGWTDSVWKGVMKEMSVVPTAEPQAVANTPPSTSSRPSHFSPSPIMAPTPREERRKSWASYEKQSRASSSDKEPPLLIRLINSGHQLFPRNLAKSSEEEPVLVDGFDNSYNDEEESQLVLERYSYEMCSVARPLSENKVLLPQSIAAESDDEYSASVHDREEDKDADGNDDEDSDDSDVIDDDMYGSSSSSSENESDCNMDDKSSPKTAAPAATTAAQAMNTEDEHAGAPTQQLPNLSDQEGNAKAASDRRMHATKFKFRIRYPHEAQALPHFKLQTWSQHEMKEFITVAEAYIESNKSKFSDVAAKDLLSAASRNRVIKFKHLQVDWGEIAACCGRQALPSTHPLKDVSALLRRRVDILGQVQSGDQGKRQCVLDYVANLSPDPQDPAMKEKYTKVVTLDGQRCCLSCFRAFVGVNRSTMFNVRTLYVNGEFVSTDLRKKEHIVVSSKAAPLTLMVINKLLEMKEYADNLPTTEGGASRELYQFPYSRQEDLYKAVNEHLNVTGGEQHNISSQTMRDAIRYLYHNFNMTISVRKKKRFMQCATCYKLDNQKQGAKDRPSRVAFQKAKSEHIFQVNIQRHDYHRLRDQAMEYPLGPLELFVILGDGMDQVKTGYPRTVRDSKDTEPSMGAIAVHVVNTFVFGGPVPILGFLNTAEIVKNSSLTVINLHRSITVQFEALMEQERVRIDDLRKNNPDATEEECRVKLTAWPRRLHICFDNAGGENMNSNVFAYLSVLVHMGVFEYITVSTLFVGHTHNINDQVFSVWSRWMDANDCVTLEMMIDGFSNNYHAFVQKEAQDAEILLNADAEAKKKSAAAASAEDEETKEEVGGVETRKFSGMAKSVLQRAKRRQELLSMIKKCGEKVKPKIERVPFNAHIGGWLPLELRTRIEKDKVFQGINSYHVFAFGKENGNTYLFRKYTVNSDIVYDNYKHEYVFKGVSYRKKHLVFNKGEEIVDDPVRAPFNFVDTTKATESLNALDRAKVFDKYPDAKPQLQAAINQLANQVVEQGDACHTCKGFVDDMARIGVISKPAVTGIPETDKEAKRQYNAHLSNRRRKQEEYNAHLEDPDVDHQGLIYQGWWTDWIKTRIPMIDAHYRSRCIFLDGNLSGAVGVTGLSAHPNDWNAKEAFAMNHTVSLCMDMYGPPRAGDIVILRAEREPHKPQFWVASIRAYRNLTLADSAHEEAVKIVAASRKLATKSSRQPWPEQPAGLNLPELVLRSADSSKVATKARKGKDALMDEKLTFEFENVLVDWYNHTTSKRKSGATASYSRKRRKSTSGKRRGADDDSAYGEEAEEDEDELPLTSFTGELESEEEKEDNGDNDDHGASAAAIMEDDGVAPLKESDISPFRSYRYVKLPENENLVNNRWMKVSQIICWGPSTSIFTKDKGITAPVWKWIVQDLTQGVAVIE